MNVTVLNIIMHRFLQNCLPYFKMHKHLCIYYNCDFIYTYYVYIHMYIIQYRKY